MKNIRIVKLKDEHDSYAVLLNQKVIEYALEKYEAEALVKQLEIFDDDELKEILGEV